MPVILVGGGSRSGKSRHALELARARGERRLFVATSQAFDDEMRQRAEAHRKERGSGFVTIEEPYDVAGALEHSSFDVAIVDCLTIWLSNLMLTGDRDIEAECDHLLRTAGGLAAPVILVSNEVGCGIVPENALARQFRDRAGQLNQRAAAVASEVYWMVFGCPLRVK